MEPTVLYPGTLFYRVFHDSPVGMVIVAPDGRIAAANDAFSQLLGQPPAALIGRTTLNLGLRHAEVLLEAHQLLSLIHI